MVRGHDLDSREIENAQGKRAKGCKKGPKVKEREQKEKGKVGPYLLAFDEARRGGINMGVRAMGTSNAGRKVSILRGKERMCRRSCR
jgi:hypothetical protein